MRRQGPDPESNEPANGGTTGADTELSKVSREELDRRDHLYDKDADVAQQPPPPSTCHNEETHDLQSIERVELTEPPHVHLLILDSNCHALGFADELQYKTTQMKHILQIRLQGTFYATVFFGDYML
ncbi:hypothetical protein PsorP6_011368 [Peronosclerospora sorghi]|uniref:Uncharacterized protein n=1 Tax=Peronosclerospora sorghi TaxID=230839 RepID=A0ACC0WMT9_9STRA|nr:hypothetical protein PsorP6_011368 [Peronosclerospora sorghi]